MTGWILVAAQAVADSAATLLQGGGAEEQVTDTATGAAAAVADSAAASEGAATALSNLFSSLEPIHLLRAAVVVVVGMPLLWGAARWARRYATESYSAQRGLIFEKLILYPGLLVILITVLLELGFSLAPLMGAAGILGIAMGFAAQTSVSNIISGFFLLAEEPFKVGDIIEVGEMSGVVMTVDMLSVKVRTFDNKLVRIPNETLVKSQVTTVTRFPIRRMDLLVGVAYKENLEHVRETLMDVARLNPSVLMEPEPLVIFMGYGDSSIDFKFTAWTKTVGFLLVKNQLLEEIKVRFDEEGIEIPFPHRTLYTGSVTDPFPVHIVQGETTPDTEGG
jgi:small-conductance mechanosensitive channel